MEGGLAGDQECAEVYQYPEHDCNRRKFYFANECGLQYIGRAGRTIELGAEDFTVENKCLELFDLFRCLAHFPDGCLELICKKARIRFGRINLAARQLLFQVVVVLQIRLQPRCFKPLFAIFLGSRFTEILHDVATNQRGPLFKE